MSFLGLLCVVTKVKERHSSSSLRTAASDAVCLGSGPLAEKGAEKAAEKLRVSISRYPGYQS